jgi:hypothetical protein
VPIINLSLTDEDLAVIEGCPFCGSSDLELLNTHTACYWIKCKECERQGFKVEVGGSSFSGGYRSERIPRRRHEMAKQSAIEAWNRRTA